MNAEVLVLAVARRRRQQQEMTGPVTKNFAKFETFRLVQPSRSRRPTFVRLIDDHKIQSDCDSFAVSSRTGR